MKLTYIACIAILCAACSVQQEKKTLDLTIQQIDFKSDNPSAEPFLFLDDSTVYLSWIEKSDSGASFKFSKLDNYGWTTPVTIASGKNWFVNWADYPMLAADGNALIAHFLQRSGEGKYAYDVKLTLSRDYGKTWTEPAVLHDDKKQAEHGFVTLLPYNGNFFVTWLDGRNTVMEGMEGMEHHEGHHGSMSLRAAIIDYSGNKLKEWELDNKTCDCCQTTAAITDSGPVVVYRDRSDEEIRDMSIVRLEEEQWTAPKSIHNDNWKIAGCPVNGPRMSSLGNSMAIAWFTSASDTAKVNVVFSNDGGNSFSDVIRIDEGNAIGRVDIDLIDKSSALVTWMEGGVVKMTRVSRDGSKDESTTLAESSDARSSGFPQLAIVGDRAIIAWTEDKSKTIRTSSIAIN